MAAGGTKAVGESILAALPTGASALAKVQGASLAMIEAAGGAYVESYKIGIRTIALTSIAFGGMGIIGCIFCEDIGHKMNSKIEIYLERFPS
jgi:hypothetical protein